METKRGYIFSSSQSFSSEFVVLTMALEVNINSFFLRFVMSCYEYQATR